MSQTETKSPESEDVQPVGRTSTTDKRPTWEVDGKLYELRRIGDFGIAGQQRLNRDGREFYQLWTADEELDDDQSMRLKFLLDRMFDGDEKVAPLLEAPKTVLRKFDDGGKADVVLTFTLAPLQKAIAAAQESQPAENQEQDQVESQDSPSTTTS